MKAERENEILELIKRGLGKPLIAQKLKITPRTVERCYKNLRLKNGLKTNEGVRTMLLTGELMATLESLIRYSISPDVAKEAQKRLTELNNTKADCIS